ncbi:MAG: ABC transporter permease subunit [Actinobacteria bacterium]|nr:ABC transporter permease subunit [Actinomycetota bacterium]
MATSRGDTTRGLTAFGEYLTRGFGAGRRRKGDPRLSFARWLRELAWRHLVGILAAGFALFPIIWIISASFNTVPSLSASRIIPESMTLENYRSLFDDPDLPFGKWLFNSFQIAFLVSALQMLMSAIAAYSFARLRWAGRRVGLLVILLVQMFPQFLAFVAVFLLLNRLEEMIGGGLQVPMALFGAIVGTALLAWGFFAWRKAMDNRERLWPGVVLGTGAALVVLAVVASSYDVTVLPGIGLNKAGLIFVYLGGSIGVNTWLIKGFYDSIPMALDESARVDGASDWQIFTKIILPLARPVLAVIFIISFVFIYNEYILASFVLRDVSQYTYAIGLALFVESDVTIASEFARLAAAAVIGGLPIVVVYVAASEYIVGGLTQGAVKG